MSSNADSSGADDGLPSARKRQKLSNDSKDDASDPGIATFPALNPNKAQEQPQRDVSCDSTDGLKSAVGGMGIDSTITTDERAGASGASSMDCERSQKKIVGLRLEAIFHPKFDNENRTTADIRNRMLERVAQSQGYLEVSLKHSGSLLLWSGGMRYYSKNSTDNRFAHAGEIILRQHFARAWNEDDTNQDDVAAESKYKECSDVVESRRLTLSFEVVTSVLGQHGDIPNRDFLILTAIADRSSEGGRGRFFDTLELVEFAQRFRLPHNDFWLYQTTESCNKLFNLYDNSRETALADGTIAALSATTGNHFESIYPHVEFQGNILEGLVIRYVSYRNQVAEGNVDSTNSAIMARTKRLATASGEILKVVPPEKAPSFAQPLKDTATKVLRTDIRTLRQDHPVVPPPFDLALAEVLDGATGGGKRRQISFLQGKHKKESFDPLRCARELLQNAGGGADRSLDPESLAIASLITKLDELHIPVDYKSFEETVGDKSRTLATIHIKNDYSFQKYSRHLKSRDLPLYRGFVVQLVFEDHPTEEFRKKTEPALDPAANFEEPLMLKMKCLPYMVRTFGLRNGLSILEKCGCEAYDRYTMNLLKAWGVSHAAMEQWQPFFHAWGIYARDLVGKDRIESSSVSNGIPALTTNTYLFHLNHFSNLFYAGKVGGKGESSTGTAGPLRGLVIVVSLTREASEEAAKDIASRLHSRRANDINSFTENDMLNAMMQGTGGVVCNATIEDGFKTVRALSKKYVQSLRIIFLNCGDAVVEKSLEPGKDLKKRIGMLKGWRKVPCKSMLEWSVPSNFNTDIDALIGEITHESVAQSPEEDESGPGLLVFFPSIPGCGKSSICSGISAETLNLNSAAKPPIINTLVGDKVEGKYWPMVRRERMSNPSSVVIADKNAPPTVWSTVGDIAAASRGLPVPVLPDQLALYTTSVKIASGRQSNFPFSLSFLAICMLRVISRPEDSHCGKLDESCKDACMVVVKFYCLYRNLSAEQFLDRCWSTIEASGAHLPSDLIRVPFFSVDAMPDLPEDLTSVIQDAIRLQIEIESSKASDFDARVLDIEGRLRKGLALHRQLLEGLVANEEDSKSSFVSQLSMHVESLENLDLAPPKIASTKGFKDPDFIKIVSIDVDSSCLTKVLQDLSSKGELALQLKSIGAIVSNDYDNVPRGTLVKEPHVTMAHHSQLSQIEMRSRFGTVVNKKVKLKVSACLFGESNIALSVILPSTVDGEGPYPIPLPAPQNKYPHITVWFGDGSVAADSNKLPDMVAAGTAKAFQPSNEIEMDGTLTFWLIDNPSPAPISS